MYRLASLITLILFVNITQTAYPQSASTLLQQPEVKTNFLSTADVSPSRSGELTVVQTDGVNNDNAVVVQKPQTVTIHTTFESKEAVIQRPEVGRIFSFTDEKPTVLPTLKIRKSQISIAWEKYNAGHFSEAATIFRSQLPHHGTHQDATFGLAMCHLAGNEYAEAVPLLENLVNRRYRIQVTLPELLRLLTERLEFVKAASYTTLLNEKERTIWQKRINEAVFQQIFAQLQQNNSIPEAVTFLLIYDKLLKQCRMTDTFSNLAAFLAQNGRPNESSQIYRTLLSCSENEETEIGLLYSLKPLLPATELFKLAEQKKSKASAEHLKKLELFTLDLLYGVLNSEPERVEETADAILKLRPEDPTALGALGWWHYNNQRYENAYGFFLQLQGVTAAKNEHVEGMIYTLTKLGRLDEALTLARLHQNYQKVAEMRKDVTLQILWSRVSALPSDSPELEVVAKKILQLAPENEAIMVVQAWSYYNREEFEKARHEFNALYTRNPLEKGYAYGLVSALRKLEKYDEALEIAVKNKQLDERLAAVDRDIYLERANQAYLKKRYKEAELYFGKALVLEPDDEDAKNLLESSKYRQTIVSEMLSPIIGLPGNSFGNLSHDLHEVTGTALSATINQGVDWLKLPWDVILRSYGEIWYRTRTVDSLYYDILGQAVGTELRKSDFRLGAEYISEHYTSQSKRNSGASIFLGWYKEWYKYLYDRSEDAGWFNIQSLSGSTYGKLAHDLTGVTGTGVSGSINQGIDWLRLPGNILLNSFVEYRYSFRTGDNVYYNEHGPVIGTEFQRSPFKAGIENYWEHNSERHLLNSRTNAYLKWYYGWNLKPDK